jgi:2-phosphoglycerate kinase
MFSIARSAGRQFGVAVAKRTDRKLRVILIGGSSNVGKSTVAAALADQIGWECKSTDSLARHPGRPWPQRNKKVPEHVEDHYLNLKAEELLESIILHHRRMSPIVAELIKSTVKNSSMKKLVLEGSALWPFIASHHNLREVHSVWLTASPETNRSRIHQSSAFVSADERGKSLITKFLERSILFEEKTTQLVSDHGCRILDVDEFKTTEAVVDKIRGDLGL